MVHVRRAELEDVSTLVNLGFEFHKAAGLQDTYPFDSTQLAKSLRRMLRASNAKVLVAVDDGVILGAAGFVTTQSFFTKTLAAYEHFWWVKQGYRGLGLGRWMLHALEEEARALGCDMMQMIALESSYPKEIGAFYRANGYFAQEHIYAKQLKPVISPGNSGSTPGTARLAVTIPDAVPPHLQSPPGV